LNKKIILVTYPDGFTLAEAKSLVDSADRQAVKIFTQKYLNHSQYGMGAGKAEEVKESVK
jgi:GTP-binding protein HflX